MATGTVQKPKKIVRPAVVVKATPLADAVLETVEAVETRVVAPKAAPVIEVVKPQPIAAKAAQKGAEKMNEAINKTQETFKKAAAETGEKATEMFNDMNARAKTAMVKAGELTKGSVEFHKGNLEAFVEAGKIAAKGTQTVAQNAAEYGRRNFEATTAMIKQAASLRSPTELFKLQGEFVRNQFDGAVAEMSKSTEFGLKLAGEMFQPIQNRYAVVAEEMKSRIAA